MDQTIWLFLSWSPRGCSEPASQACRLAWVVRRGRVFLSNVTIIAFPIHGSLWCHGVNFSCWCFQLLKTVSTSHKQKCIFVFVFRLAVSKFDNFDPFKHWNLMFWYSKHVSYHCEGSQKCIFHVFRPWPHRNASNSSYSSKESYCKTSASRLLSYFLGLA